MEEEPEMEEEEEDVPEEDVGEDGGMMESEILEDASGGMTAEGRKRQKRQTMPYMTKYERARILGSVIPPPRTPPFAAVALTARVSAPAARAAAKHRCAALLCSASKLAHLRRNWLAPSSDI
jgi:hypothetical protein